MRTVELELDDQTLELAERAARARECTVGQLLRDLLEALPSNRQPAVANVGFFQRHFISCLYSTGTRRP